MKQQSAALKLSTDIEPTEAIRVSRLMPPVEPGEIPDNVLRFPDKAGLRAAPSFSARDSLPLNLSGWSSIDKSLRFRAGLAGVLLACSGAALFLYLGKSEKLPAASESLPEGGLFIGENGRGLAVRRVGGSLMAEEFDPRQMVPGAFGLFSTDWFEAPPENSGVIFSNQESPRVKLEFHNPSVGRTLAVDEDLKARALGASVIAVTRLAEVFQRVDGQKNRVGILTLQLGELPDYDLEAGLQQFKPAWDHIVARDPELSSFRGELVDKAFKLVFKLQVIQDHLHQDLLEYIEHQHDPNENIALFNEFLSTVTMDIDEFLRVRLGVLEHVTSEIERNRSGVSVERLLGSIAVADAMMFGQLYSWGGLMDKMASEDGVWGKMPSAERNVSDSREARKWFNIGSDLTEVLMRLALINLQLSNFMPESVFQPAFASQLTLFLERGRNNLARAFKDVGVKPAEFSLPDTSINFSLIEGYFKTIQAAKKK